MELISNKIEFEYKSNLGLKEQEKLKEKYIKEAYKLYFEENYSSNKFLKISKPIKNTNGVATEILKEVLQQKSFRFIEGFSVTTIDKKNLRGFLYFSDNKYKFGIYAGKHYFIKKKIESEKAEYLFAEIPTNENLLENYLYKTK